MFTKADIETYFSEEKKESLLFLVIGITSVLTGIIFLVLLQTNFSQGMAIPLVAIGVLLCVAGYTVYKRCDEDRKRIVYAYDMAPGDLRSKEWPRMLKVMRNFKIYRYTEIFLFILGIGIYVYFFRDSRNEFWRGMGLGFAIMSLMTLVADYFAEKRGKLYSRGIETFIQGNNP